MVRLHALPLRLDRGNKKHIEAAYNERNSQNQKMIPHRRAPSNSLFFLVGFPAGFTCGFDNTLCLFRILARPRDKCLSSRDPRCRRPRRSLSRLYFPQVHLYPVELGVLDVRDKREVIIFIWTAALHVLMQFTLDYGGHVLSLGPERLKTPGLFRNSRPPSEKPYSREHPRPPPNIAGLLREGRALPPRARHASI